MGGLDKEFLLPHRARSAHQPALPLSRGERNGCEVRGVFLGAIVGSRGS